MDFAYPREVLQFREQFGHYLDSVVTPELLGEISTAGQRRRGR